MLVGWWMVCPASMGRDLALGIRGNRSHPFCVESDGFMYRWVLSAIRHIYISKYLLYMYICFPWFCLIAMGPQLVWVWVFVRHGFCVPCDGSCCNCVCNEGMVCPICLNILLGRFDIIWTSTIYPPTPIPGEERAVCLPGQLPFPGLKIQLVDTFCP